MRSRGEINLQAFSARRRARFCFDDREDIALERAAQKNNLLNGVELDLTIPGAADILNERVENFTEMYERSETD